MLTRYSPLPLLIVCAGVLLLVGCSAPAATPTTSATPSSSAVPTATPTAAAPETPGAASGAGCPSGGEPRPSDTYAAAIDDLDGDGEADSEWYAETSPFRYGVTTASGATFSVNDGLAGPGTHRGWSARLANGVVVTVLDDGRGATLHAIVDCAFVTPLDVLGEPYRFDLQNRLGNGTGVGCRMGTTGRELVGFQTDEQSDGRFDVTTTEILVSIDGTTATNGTRTRSDLAADDPAVTEAQTSSCGTVTIVATTGR
ncbi:hypothetical protein [Cryobacterium sp. CG_9.6]|uniref:hypothetical protein n=1 Tax=Cryobacterium sp. CG_9.6 TaxID=2760710 RepID=UPI00247520DA|nr:hypothetical protein [Cryobacterium sp. CG_9.6]MDH6237619.1 hypothetical protein [Cryobacterium sp. CG_9.6]